MQTVSLISSFFLLFHCNSINLKLLAILCKRYLSFLASFYCIFHSTPTLFLAIYLLTLSISSMASACINNVGVSPENLYKYKSYSYPPEVLDPQVSVNEMVNDFEFRLENPVNMLPADELFSDGKLMPLQLPTVRPATTSIRSPETQKLYTDPYLCSPKAPRCSSRWKELLGLKKLPHNEEKHEAQKSWKSFLNRSSKTSSNDDDSSINLPLLNKDTSTDCYNECISVSSSSRLSLSSSSSSSCHEHDDLPARLSLDSDKPNILINNINQNSNPNPPRIRLVKHRQQADSTGTLRGLSIDDSPRMNSSGKIIFHNLGRSASSPSSFNSGGGSRYNKHGGVSVERSYSANVRVTPVLNVPVCSSLRRSSKSGVFRFSHFSSSGTAAVNKKHHSSTTKPNRTDRIKE